MSSKTTKIADVCLYVELNAVISYHFISGIKSNKIIRLKFQACFLVLVCLVLNETLVYIKKIRKYYRLLNLHFLNNMVVLFC